MSSLPEVVLVAGLAGGATGLGALPVLFTDRVSHRVYDAALGLAAGIMFGAAVFALVLPGLELGSLAEVSVGVLAGGGFLLGANALLPHLHMEFAGEYREGPPAVEEDGLKRALLVGSAITIHNVPEGLAVGIAFASGEEAVGLALALAIAVQNGPDGFAMAVPAVSAGVSKAKRVIYTTLSGGVPEPAAAALGFGLVVLVTDLFLVAAGFAAGAMIESSSGRRFPPATATATRVSRRSPSSAGSLS